MVVDLPPTSRVEHPVHRLVFAAAAIGVTSLVIVVAMRRAPASVPTARGCDGFDFPVGPPDGTGYYDAQPFGTNNHLGNDWNGNGGLDTDLGDPVHAVSAGIVVEAKDHGGGWGNVVRIVHGCGIESLYAHLDTIEVTEGAAIPRGRRIGTIGTANGQYLAHLHFELRDLLLPLGAGYATERTGYLDPTAYIRSHRPPRP